MEKKIIQLAVAALPLAIVPTKKTSLGAVTPLLSITKRKHCLQKSVFNMVRTAGSAAVVLDLAKL